jgi:hypothetical protein
MLNERRKLYEKMGLITNRMRRSKYGRLLTSLVSSRPFSVKSVYLDSGQRMQLREIIQPALHARIDPADHLKRFSGICIDGCGTGPSDRELVAHGLIIESDLDNQ